MSMHDDIEEILFTEEQIRERVRELGQMISRDYEGKDLLILVILRGAVMFLADLARSLSINAEIDFMVVTRYGYSDRPGQLKILRDLEYPVENRHILIVEDIIDEGGTLRFLVDTLLLRNPASVKICTMFDKPARRKVEITPDYNGFTIPDKWVVGYGLDCKQHYRNLPYLGTLRGEAASRL